MKNLEYNGVSAIAFADANVSPWYALGKNVKGVTNTTKAIKEAELDFTVVKKPLFVKLGIKYQQVPESYATVRKDINKVLGSVGEKYSVLQNVMAFKFFDPILQKHGATMESVGMLGEGERIFISAKLHNPIVLSGNDVIDQDLLVMSSHDGKSGTSVVFTPTRLLSQTTLNGDFGLATPNRKSIKHTSNQLTRTYLGSEIIEMYEAYRKRLEEVFNIMADTPIYEDDYETIIVKGLADTSSMVKKYFDPHAKQSTRFRNNVKAALNYAFTHPTQCTVSTDMTLFGAYNAVSGWYQNEGVWNGDIENKMRSIIDSNGRVNLKQQQTFEAVLKMLPKPKVQIVV